MDTEDGVVEDLVQIPLKESWHLRATVEKSFVELHNRAVIGQEGI